MSTTNYLNLALTEATENNMTFLQWRSLMNGKDCDSNMEIIDQAFEDVDDRKVGKVGTPVTGNLASLSADGGISDSGKKPADFENAGAASTVQQNLTTHQNNKQNPHEVTVSQIGAATSAQGGKADSAVQIVKVNGTALTPDANKAVNIDISGKADKIPTPTNGNLAGMDANGNITNSGKKASDFESAGAAATVQQNLNSHTGNTSNPHRVTASQVGAATSGQGAKADSAIQGVKVNGSALTPDASKIVNVDISGKIDKVTSATNGNFAKFNASGSVEDSGKKATDFESSGAAATVQQNLNSHTGNTSNPHSVTASQVGAATSAQGTKADSAIQSVKLAGTALSSDASKAVDIPLVSGSSNGLAPAFTTGANLKFLRGDGTWQTIRFDSEYVGVDLSTVFASVAAFRTAVSSGDFSLIHIGDYWPITLSGTYRDYGTYTCPSGTTYYSDTALATSVGTTSSVMDAVYVNATYCEVTISGTKYYVSTTNCIEYRERTMSNAVVKLEVAGINHYWKYGDSGALIGALNHILFCSRDCLPNVMRMRRENSTWEDATATTPWLGCAAYRTFNDPDYGIINLVAATEIGAYIYAGPNSKGMRALLPLMAPGSSTTTSWSWQDRGKLFLPMEREVWGSAVHQTHALHGGLAPQWPVFANGLKKICKGLGNGGSRCSWWCATATSATYFAFVSSGGYPGTYDAVNAFGVPLCFIFA